MSVSIFNILCLEVFIYSRIDSRSTAPADQLWSLRKRLERWLSQSRPWHLLQSFCFPNESIRWTVVRVVSPLPQAPRRLPLTRCFVLLHFPFHSRGDCVQSSHSGRDNMLGGIYPSLKRPSHIVGTMPKLHRVLT